MAKKKTILVKTEDHSRVIDILHRADIMTWNPNSAHKLYFVSTLVGAVIGIVLCWIVMH